MPPRIPLPLLNSGSRAAVTCEYRCGNACSHDAPNPSANEYLGDIVTNVINRRGALKAGAVVTFAASGVVGLTGSAAADGRRGTPGVNFERVQPNTLDAVVVPPGYEQAVVIRWGDAVLPGAPAFNFDAQTADAQAKQFGYNCDFAALMPLPGSDQLLVTNHEYTSESFMFKGYSSANPTEEQVRIGWAAHGLSVVEVEQVRGSGRLKPVIGRYNRRITMTTPFRMTGPAAGSDLLKTSADPTGTVALGTLNNCAGGVTPWGTILSGEENFNQYWANAGQTAEPVKSRAARYGITAGATSRKWERYDKRFDMLQEPNEVNRFGYVIELDPYDPESTPVKHTALGRFKHECANVRVARDGRVVAYSGDDERFEYLYKFVSKNKMRKGHSRAARRYNMTLLDEGTLYVARFTGDSPPSEIDGTGKLPSDKRFDGTGEWIPLASGNRSFVAGMTAEEVYVFTRLAADKAGATRMDRPEDVQASPKTGKVYVALSNNVERGVTPGKESATEPNPRNNNKHGHVLELTEHDPLSLRFDWWLFLVCGDPKDPNTYFAGFPRDQVSPISSPDNVAFDPYGNLWISTDSAGALGINDGLYAVPVDGPERGNLKLFLTVPRGAETCGPIVQERLVTVCVQHPGELDNHSAENPASHWPDGGDSQPRPSVVAVWKPGRRGPERIGF